MTLRAFDPNQTFTWTHPDYPGIECTLRPLSAREMAEAQASTAGIGMLAVACRGLFAIKGEILNADDKPRELIRERTPSGRGIVAEEFFDGLPTAFWQGIALEVLRRSHVSEAQSKN